MYITITCFLSLLLEVNLNDEPDRFLWNHSESVPFTVSSMYQVLLNLMQVPSYKLGWKIKVPLKVKIFFVVSVAWRSTNKG